MTLGGALTLLLIMTSLAALPGTSSMLVVAQRVRVGLAQALAVIAGIVLVDMPFVALALLGMSALTANSNLWILPLQLLAAAYLIWLGVSLWQSTPGKQTQAHHKGLLASFLAGALITAADIKALVFYAGLLPQFLKMEALTLGDALWVFAITLVSVAGGKLVYALAAGFIAERLAQATPNAWPRKLAACLLVGLGLWLLLFVF
ncbi:MAG TPA: LysE family transporter [Marinobacter sp.]|nr:LysE family transporter [Marinobacter sp.]